MIVLIYMLFRHKKAKILKKFKNRRLIDKKDKDFEL